MSQCFDVSPLHTRNVAMLRCLAIAPLRCRGVMISDFRTISTAQHHAFVALRCFTAAMACHSDGAMLWRHHSAMPYHRGGFMLRCYSVVVLRHCGGDGADGADDDDARDRDHGRGGRFCGRYIEPSKTLYIIGIVHNSRRCMAG